MEKILFFDGVCNLCNGFIDALMHSQYSGKFAPLQGPTAQGKLAKEDLNLSSVVYFRDGEVFRESRAIARVLRDSKGFYAFAGFLVGLAPEFLAQAVYRQVAKNRYRIFGQRETCRLPSAEERARFLP